MLYTIHRSIQHPSTQYSVCPASSAIEISNNPAAVLSFLISCLSYIHSARPTSIYSPSYTSPGPTPTLCPRHLPPQRRTSPPAPLFTLLLFLCPVYKPQLSGSCPTLQHPELLVPVRYFSPSRLPPTRPHQPLPNTPTRWQVWKTEWRSTFHEQEPTKKGLICVVLLKPKG